MCYVKLLCKNLNVNNIKKKSYYIKRSLKNDKATIKLLSSYQDKKYLH